MRALLLTTLLLLPTTAHGAGLRALLDAPIGLTECLLVGAASALMYGRWRTTRAVI